MEVISENLCLVMSMLNNLLQITSCVDSFSKNENVNKDLIEMISVHSKLLLITNKQIKEEKSREEKTVEMLKKMKSLIEKQKIVIENFNSKKISIGVNTHTIHENIVMNGLNLSVLYSTSQDSKSINSASFLSDIVEQNNHV
jgi:hypothetical protein